MIPSTQILKRINRGLIDLMKMYNLYRDDPTKADEYQQKLASIMQLLKEQNDLKSKNNILLCEDLNNMVNYQLKKSID